MNYRNESTERLFSVIAGLKDENECAMFFEDLCTIKEIQDMAQRLETAVLLNSGENYQNISAKVGASSATISRVNRSLQYGCDGYDKIFERIKEEENE